VLGGTSLSDADFDALDVDLGALGVRNASSVRVASFVSTAVPSGVFASLSVRVSVRAATCVRISMFVADTRVPGIAAVPAPQALGGIRVAGNFEGVNFFVAVFFPVAIGSNFPVTFGLAVANHFNVTFSA
jgi:hypothetical protein